MGVLGKDLLDFHRPRTNTKVEFGASGYWVESHPTMQPYVAVLTEILNLDAAPFQELLDQYRKTVAEKDAEQAARAFQAVTNGFASLPLYRLYWDDVQLFASMDVRTVCGRSAGSVLRICDAGRYAATVHAGAAGRHPIDSGALCVVPGQSLCGQAV